MEKARGVPGGAPRSSAHAQTAPRNSDRDAQTVGDEKTSQCTDSDGSGKSSPRTGSHDRRKETGGKKNRYSVIEEEPQKEEEEDEQDAKETDPLNPS